MKKGAVFPQLRAPSRVEVYDFGPVPVPFDQQRPALRQRVSLDPPTFPR